MRYDVTIIGAGIIGLATGYKIVQKNPGLKVLILEKEAVPAKHQTGNNSGVIHAGIYYKPGSAKALNCREGYRQLTEFCNTHAIPHDICGKLIVAADKSELQALDRLYQRGLSNGLSEIKKIHADEIKDYEPYARGLAAIHVPYTGIVDYKTVSYKFREIIDNQGHDIWFNNKVNNIIEKSDEVFIETGHGEYHSKYVINTAGLYSDRIARLTKPSLNVRIIPFRGEYVELKKEKQHLVNNLIYPVPNPEFPFLGVHFTRMIHGGIEAGPNAVWAFSREGYKFSTINLRDVFEALSWSGFRNVMKQYWKIGLGEYYRSLNRSALTAAMQKMIPDIESKDLISGGGGVRAQACLKNGGLVDDFLFDESKRIIHVLNAPSPAATASMAIADTISDKLTAKMV